MKKVRIARSNTPQARLRRQLRGIRGLCGLVLDSYKNQRQAELTLARTAKTFRDMELQELEKARKGNQIVLLDIEIERRKIELARLKEEQENRSADSFAQRLT